MRLCRPQHLQLKSQDEIAVSNKEQGQKTWREKVKQNFLPNACTPFEQHERQ
jgi:hypothetical protein